MTMNFCSSSSCSSSNIKKELHMCDEMDNMKTHEHECVVVVVVVVVVLRVVVVVVRRSYYV